MSPIDTLAVEAFEYVQEMWHQKHKLYKKTTVDILKRVIEPYSEFYETLIPDDTPATLRPYIHRERILYDMFQKDKLMVFRYYPTEESDDDSESFYSNSELEEDEEKTKFFVNGVLLLDEYYYREQLSANEFTGGYWERDHHWVLSREKLFRALRSD